MGISNENLIGFTRTMAELGVTTNLTSVEAATAFARFAKVTDLPQEKIGNLGSTLVNLGNNLATTEKEILDMGLRLAGTGNVIGLTQDQILGFAGALSSVGVRAEAGGSAFSKVMSDIASAVASGGEEVAEFAKVAGQSTDDFSKSFTKTPAKAIQTFIEGLAKVKLEGGNTFGVLDDLDLSNIRIRTALLNTAGAGDLVGESLGFASEAFGDTAALTDEAAERFKTFESKMGVFKNTMNDLAIDFGDVLLPVILDITESIKPWIKRFKELSPKTKKIIVIVAGLVAVLGPLLIFIGFIASGIAALVPVFTAAAAVIAFIVSPIGLVILAIVALIAIGVLIVRNWDTIKDAAMNLANDVKDWFIKMKDGVTTTVNNFVNKIKERFTVLKDGVIERINNLINPVKERFNSFKDRLIEIAQNITNTVKDWFTKLKDGIIERVSNAVTPIVDKFIAIKDRVIGIVTTFRDLLTGVWDSIKDKAIGAFNALKSAIKGIWDGLVSVIKTAANNIIGLINTLVRGFNKIINLAGKIPIIGATIKGFSIPEIPEFAKGGIVTKPTLAIVGEKGPEAIIPLSGQNAVGAGVTINGNVILPGVRDVDGFMNELNTQSRNANLRGRVVNG